MISFKDGAIMKTTNSEVWGILKKKYMYVMGLWAGNITIVLNNLNISKLYFTSIFKDMNLCLNYHYDIP